MDDLSTNIGRPDVAPGMQPGFDDYSGVTTGAGGTPAVFVVVNGSRLPNDSSVTVGSSAFLRHQELSTDGVTAFTITSPSVEILQPNGVPYTGISSIQAIPGGAAISQELRAVWTPQMGGPHVVNWSFSVNGLNIGRTEEYFVGWTDIPSVVRRRLRETSTSLPDVDIDAEVAVTVQQLIDRFVELQRVGGYQSLAGLDQERFDTCAAYLTAISMRFYRMKMVPIGELSTVKLNQNSFSFTPGQEKGEVSIEAKWLQEALLSLGRVTLVQQAYAAAANSFKPFVVSGPTRYKEQTGHIETLMSGVLRLLSDRWDDTPGFYYGDEGWGQV